MNQRLRPLSCFLTLALLAVCSTEAAARAGHKPQQTRKPHEATGGRHHGSAALKKAAHARHVAAAQQKPARSSSDVPPPAVDAAPLSGDLAAVRDAMNLARKAKTSEATAIEKTIGDPAARKLVEWFILRHPATDANFSRYAAFIADNPGWPSRALMRKRAEADLWQERSDAATVRNFVGDQPTSAKGRFALARARLAEGDRDGAERLVRQAWRSDELSERSEADALELFRDLLTREDHRARMDKRIGAKDLAGAKRVAQRLGSDELAIVKACAAGSADEALDLLNDVPAEARGDLGYTLCRLRWMVRHDRIDDATRLVLSAAPENMALQDTDEWWRERRGLARKLLDQGKSEAAYQVVRNAALPASEPYRADFHFMCGWIALRYRNDPAAARAHFAHIDDGSANPIVLARAYYWRGRAAEATGEQAEMRTFYEAAARYPTAYYGQLARARLSLDRAQLRAPVPAEATDDATLADERVRAADMLYALGERDVVLSFVADLAEESTDVAVLAALAELTGRHNDARAMLQIGKPALARGLALDNYAFPTIGIPQHSPIGPEIERSIIYSVARTESAFDQRDKSSANAVGLMQVTPEAGRDTAKRFGATYDWDRMVSDPVYNTQMGAAELSALLREYAGSHIMTFAGYNAGRGRVRDWVKLYGDPRDPNVDAIDWVERIPLSETRNYVQRVMENLQVYRLRFDGGASVASKSNQRLGNSHEANSALLLLAPTPAPDGDPVIP
ncbi:lytic transglycosylase domain-containing protein [Bradyrhizobium erythrophlei]|uniref:Soluble lytic murein transglycosylase n=1 Tax=Bradyrhizobium erythrophlei TaxID=1437360 RepID=A0A1M5KTM4_9BRAD|nr:lytic transglycosylase domain-containing protein [Bradyrhizobium erythrophlei]SHG56030.1 soluble lytic murein transglycosylase [Bradyrhizobium erythrophlei]